MNKSIIRIPFRFAEYREKKLFLDCEYSINGIKYRAHKIVLANYSSLFAEYFSTNDSSIVPIPFRDDLFNFMIDYFYNGSMELPDNEIDRLIPLFAMSIIYGVNSLREIVWPLIIKQLNLTSNKKLVFVFTKLYKDFELNVTESLNYPSIYENYENLLQTQREFVRYIVDNFDFENDDMETFFKSVTPFLLSEVLKEKNLSNEVNASIIDKCMETITNVSETDMRNLQSVIDWSDNDVYLLFSDYKMNWVTADISRQYLEKLLFARSITSNSFLETAQNLNTDYVNNWYTVSHIQLIRSSREDTCLPEIEAMDFIGTFGNTKDPFHNPILYELIDAECTPNLSDPDVYGTQNILDKDPESYYISDPAINTKPEVGISFLKSMFKLTAVEMKSAKGRKMPRTVELLLDGVPYKSMKMNDDTAVFTIEPNVAPVNKVVVRMLEPTIPIMRVSSLKIFGTFSTELK